MSIVNTETGEVIEPLTEADASRLTERIRLTLSSMLDQRDKVLSLIREARDRMAFTALGYPSWTAYVADEFADALPRLGREDRVTMAVELADSGMSNRAIGSVLGISEPTVRRDLERASYDARPPVTDTLGRQQPATKPPAPRPIGEVGRGAGQTREGEEPEAPVPPASEPAPSIAVPPRPPVDALADAIAEFPEVAYFAEKGDPGKAIETARNLRSYSEREQPMRRENLRKWIAADQRGAFDKKPTREVTGADVMQALATAFGYLARAGGTDRVADDLLAEDPDALDFNRTALDQYAAQLGDLIDALVPTLRSIK